jgi:hypothetical protein
MIFGDLNEFRTEKVGNTSLERYRYANPLDRYLLNIWIG